MNLVAERGNKQIEFCLSAFLCPTALCLDVSVRLSWLQQKELLCTAVITHTHTVSVITISISLTLTGDAGMRHVQTLMVIFPETWKIRVFFKVIISTYSHSVSVCKRNENNWRFLWDLLQHGSNANVSPAKSERCLSLNSCEIKLFDI